MLVNLLAAPETSPDFQPSVFHDLNGLFFKKTIMFTRFIKSEDGSNAIEYALMIAMISISLLLLLQPLAITANFNNLISRFGACLTRVCI